MAQTKEMKMLEEMIAIQERHVREMEEFDDDRFQYKVEARNTLGWLKSWRNWKPQGADFRAKKAKSQPRDSKGHFLSGESLEEVEK